MPSRTPGPRCAVGGPALEPGRDDHRVARRAIDTAPPRNDPVGSASGAHLRTPRRVAPARRGAKRDPPDRVGIQCDVRRGQGNIQHPPDRPPRRRASRRARRRFSLRTAGAPAGAVSGRQCARCSRMWQLGSPIPSPRSALLAVSPRRRSPGPSGSAAPGARSPADPRPLQSTLPPPRGARSISSWRPRSAER